MSVARLARVKNPKGLGRLVPRNIGGLVCFFRAAHGLHKRHHVLLLSWVTKTSEMCSDGSRVSQFLVISIRTSKMTKREVENKRMTKRLACLISMRLYNHFWGIERIRKR
jgi:hypothetical protein